MKSKADLFDVFGDYPEVVPVPVAQAVKEFREYMEGHHAHFVPEGFRIRTGTSTRETRAATGEAWDIGYKRVELQLFRSIMADGGIS